MHVHTLRDFILESPFVFQVAKVICNSLMTKSLKWMLNISSYFYILIAFIILLFYSNYAQFSLSKLFYLILPAKYTIRNKLNFISLVHLKGKEIKFLNYKVEPYHIFVRILEH